MRTLSIPLAFGLALSTACGGAAETGKTRASDPSGRPPAVEGLIARNADPMCGAGFRWASDKCVPGDDERAAAADKKKDVRERKTEGGLLVEDINVGTGREVRAGDIVKLHYTGTLADGVVFDSSRSQGTPFEFRVGQGQVIKGFDRGVLGMKVGGRRKVTIPYQLGYGIEGAPPRIPPKATLVFDLDLIDVM
ncbi:MAG: FKBP-type peptidyl-prolyl cis-trans isomerase [Myxococcales bacterium]|nr:FKBP-type peptidyl-prolyl cis-trans isomerase [Myxococcales bacterium]